MTKIMYSITITIETDNHKIPIEDYERFLVGCLGQVIPLEDVTVESMELEVEDD